MKRPYLRRKKSHQSAKSAKPTKQQLEGIPSGKQIAIELVVIFSIIILGVTSFLWWHYIISNPKRVFRGMLNNALQEPSGTEQIIETSNGQTLNQTIQFMVNGQHVAHAYSSLSQPGSTALTETIGTPTKDFVRYTDIKTSQKSVSGLPLNFSKVLNVWGETENSTGKTNGQLYNQVVLGAIPFGNLSYSQREDLLKLMLSAYSVNYSNVSRSKVNGRPTYAYDVDILPQDYVIMLKKYAAVSGLNQLEQLDPATYVGATSLHVRVTVDVWSRQLLSIGYSKSGRLELFSQFGQQRPPLAIPTQTITITELESRLQNLQ